MPRRPQEHLDARRRQILDAARRCFVRDGFHATSMQDVLAEAELSVGAVYRYFKGKDDIIAAIVAEALAEVATTFDPDDPGSAAPPGRHRRPRTEGREAAPGRLAGVGTAAGPDLGRGAALAGTRRAAHRRRGRHPRRDRPAGHAAPGTRTAPRRRARRAGGRRADRVRRRLHGAARGARPCRPRCVPQPPARAYVGATRPTSDSPLSLTAGKRWSPAPDRSRSGTFSAHSGTT
jgi:AcrR family transcriptional regulator